MGGKQVIVIYDEDINAPNSNGKLTAPVIIVCMVVASAGFTYGYETGSYGVTTMQPFLKQFFPSLLYRVNNMNQGQYCILSTWQLSAYGSVLYVAGIFSAILAGRLTTSAGRKGALIIGGIIYLIGVSLQGVAVNFTMLILGRALIGFGIGFTNQAAPIYLIEMAPTKWRGAVATAFPLFFEIGASIAKFVVIYLLRYYSNYKNSWRILVGLCGIPATIMTIIAFFVPDTPTSLIQRGKVQEALKSLNQVRSVDVDTETELKYLINYHEAMKNASEKPYQMLFERKYRPQLLLAIAIPIFRHLTGIHLITYFRHILFRFQGFSSEQVVAVVFLQGIACVLSVILVIFLIDRIGRRILFLEAGLQLLICQVVLGILMASETVDTGFSKRFVITALCITGFLTGAFSRSWGSLNWILPSELLSMEVRPAGQGLSLAFNFAFQSLAMQIALPLLCYLKYGVFLFYAGCILIMTIFVILFVPETQRVPIESMDIMWGNHWYWKRFVHEPHTCSSQIPPSVKASQLD